MQLKQIARDALLKPLQAVSGIVERRQTLPILANVLIEHTDGQLHLTATDLEMQITALADCEANGLTPEKPFKGSFNVRVSPELHQKAAFLASEEKMSLNTFVAESIRERIFRQSGLKV